ncbi:hypothetical protein DY120_07440 [Apilactobacillus micheneri]|uniref:Cyanophage baseplate Pam3 plug gp18 domain-containing protein n=1 Tax=Apilactobacillus micheneri TaxID=1899430 RepID=A0ABY2YWE5_9LACO|nr:hypothetical protein [Apilactobacillus micheneri]TPR23131.1 hypothetical protein DY114_07425 [Apilactobacillus micheneri]TPR24449.1 hypothetical protein DY111_07440 [Apilactobacillus micheneri]TPR29396.1 hypothetical protein DY120_07440 [Apilactobacillus micheneri]TPR34603.1 hypothetical protein DY027_07430 [Apilactobacillus micheneri]
MTVHDVVPVDVDAIPYQQPVELLDTTYIFDFEYNAVSDYFYINLYDYDGNLIISGEPIFLNIPLFRNISNDNLPIETIIPMDESGQATEVNSDNLGNTVNLCIDDL